MTGASIIAGSSSTSSQENTVALVNGKAITKADLRLATAELDTMLKRVPPEHHRRLAAEYVIGTQLFADAAEQAGAGSGPAYEDRLIFAMRRVLRDIYIDKFVLEAVTEAEANRLYGEQTANLKPEEEVHVRHILLASEPQAKELRGRLTGGADFATMAKALSEDSTSSWRGGDLGWWAKSQLNDQFAEAAFILRNKGDISEPVQTEFGWHLIQLEDRRMRPVPDFAAVKERLRVLLIKNKAEELSGNLREKANIVYLDPDLQRDAGAAPPPKP